MKGPESLKPAQQEIQPQQSLFTEVMSADGLKELLMTRGADEQTLASEKVRGNLVNLLERTKDAEKKLFVMDVGGDQWAVVANSEQEVRQVQGKLEELSKLQGSMDPEKLWGMCIYVHEFASALKISDGNLNGIQERGDLEKSVYAVHGIHAIGYVDMLKQKKTIYFDLTAKPYVFTDGYGSGHNAVMQGIIIIEGIGESSAVESLYQRHWHRDPFNPDEPLSQHAIRKGREFLRRGKTPDAGSM